MLLLKTPPTLCHTKKEEEEEKIAIHVCSCDQCFASSGKCRDVVVRVELSKIISLYCKTPSLHNWMFGPIQKPLQKVELTIQHLWSNYICLQNIMKNFVFFPDSPNSQSIGFY